jgi:hypothetical protein
MRAGTRIVIGVGLTVGFVASLGAGPAAAASGTERFSGFLIASGRSGGRDVLATGLTAKGVFNGHGRIVEVDSQPGDPDNVLRDDLVFADGTMHLISTNVDSTFSIDPRTCRARFAADQTGTIDGGTGRFANASGAFTGSVDGTLLFARLPDGSCDLDRAPVIERDDVAASGTLSF